MSDSFEPEESTTVQVQPPVLPLVRGAVGLVATLWVCVHAGDLGRVLRRLVPWLDGTHEAGDWSPLFHVTAVALYALAFVLAAMAAAAGMRFARGRRRSPRGTVTVRADAAGLHAGDQLLLARELVTRVEVTTDPDVGFAIEVEARDGLVFRCPLRSEADAHAMAAVLLPRHDPSATVFVGLADRRARETVIAVVAAGGAFALSVLHEVLFRFVVSDLLYRAFGAPWEWWKHPEHAFFWGEWLAMLIPLGVAMLSVAAARPVLRRLKPGRVWIDARGLRLGEGRSQRCIAREALAGVEAQGAASVALALRDGTTVRLDFAGDRSLVEREAFIRRVRELLANPPTPAWPAAEASGVRVAHSPDTRAALGAGDDEEELDAIEPQPRTRRRG